MEIKSSLYLLLILFTFVPAKADEAKYNFSTSKFQLGPWSPATLKYEQGLKKIRSLDSWFYQLNPSDRQKYVDEYTINRNRLFIVTQEKRLAREARPGLTEQALGLFAKSGKFSPKDPPTWTERAIGTDESVKALRSDAMKQHAKIKGYSDRILNDPEILKSRVFNELDDLSRLTSKEVGVNFSGKFSQSFSKSYSKSNMASSGTQLAGASHHSDELPLLSSMDLKAALQKQVVKNPLLDASSGYCKEFEVQPHPFEEFFDSTKNPKIARFLKELEVPQKLSARKSNDLSSWYSEPTTQWSNGTPLGTCAGHAIASNAMAALYKKNLIKVRALHRDKKISPDHTYAVAQYQEIATDPELLKSHAEEIKQHYPQLDPNSKGYCSPKNYENTDPYQGFVIDQALKTFSSVPLCSLDSESGSQKEMYKIDQFSTVEFDHRDKKPSFEVIKALIDSGNPPMATLKTDQRLESSGWFRIKGTGDIRHVLNIVGYDEGIDPLSLCPTKYFIVRDSMGTQKMHYKVPVNNFLSQLDGLFHISKIHQEVSSNSSSNGARATGAQ